MPVPGFVIVRIKESDRGHPRPVVGRDRVVLVAEDVASDVVAELARNRAALEH